MGCPKSVVNCPDRLYKANNAGASRASVSKPLSTKGASSNQTIINGKKYTVTPKKR
jgi:hypothetical protein